MIALSSSDGKPPCERTDVFVADGQTGQMMVDAEDADISMAMGVSCSSGLEPFLVPVGTFFYCVYLQYILL